MCTLTWLPARDGEGYDLLFNRDELDARGPEIPPELSLRHGTRVVAPRDAERGGTWIALNHYGLTVALLNFYPQNALDPTDCQTASVEPFHYASRGDLPWLGADASDVNALESRLRSEPLELYRAFHLVAVDANGESRWFRWDGMTLRMQTAPPFVTSSSYRTARVEAERQARFERLAPVTVETLQAFHREHSADRGAASICMRRDDGRTRSLTTVCVRAERRELTYETIAWDRSIPERHTVALR